jgi:hypothetical protein
MKLLKCSQSGFELPPTVADGCAVGFSLTNQAQNSRSLTDLDCQGISDIVDAWLSTFLW